MSIACTILLPSAGSQEGAENAASEHGASAAAELADMPLRLLDRLQLRIGGYSMVDWAEIAQSEGLDGIGEIRDGGEVRETRLQLRGQFNSKLTFQLSLDIDDDRIQLVDTYLTRHEVPVLGEVQIGHFKEPFGLEHLTSSRYAAFMERSLASAIVPTRGVGIRVANTVLGERAAWTLGAFYEAGSFEDFRSNETFSITGRVTGTPYYDDENERLFHLGASYSHRTPQSAVEYGVRPEVNLAPRYLDTGEFSSGSLDVFGVEAAYQDRSWLAQAEAVWVQTSDTVREEDITLNDIADELSNRLPRLADWLSGKTDWERPSDSFLWNIPFDLAARNDLDYFGAYGQISYVITGERREYNKARGVFGPIVPAKPVRFGRDGGWGAWEVAARMSHVDLNDEFVDGGRETNLSLGLNWYLTKEVRVSLDYVHADISRDVYEGEMDAVMMRVQLDVAPRHLRRQMVGRQTETDED